MKPARDALFHEAHAMVVRAVAFYAWTPRCQMLRATFDRDDWLQIGLISVWTALPSFDGARSSLRTFVDRVVFRAIVSCARAQRAAKRRAPAHTNAVLGNYDLMCDDRIDFERVLSTLERKDRRLADLMMRHSPSEVSRIQNVSRSTIQSGVKRLCQAFTAAGFEGSDQRPPMRFVANSEKLEGRR